jgi:hypothetical protein
MLLSLDNVAQRYGVLPSVALREGTTVDLLVLQTASKYAEWKETPEYKNNKGHTTKALQRMVEGVNNASNKNKG